MNEVAVETVLGVISGLGSASLETVMRELDRDATAIAIARTFQAARADGLIEIERDRVATSDPLYRLTPAGLIALPQQSPRTVDERRLPAPRGSNRSEEVSLEDVLSAMAEFDEFGGASRALVAWELIVDERALASAWSEAIDEGLVQRAATDISSGEEMWRLSQRGWRTRQGYGRATG